MTLSIEMELWWEIQRKGDFWIEKEDDVERARRGVTRFTKLEGGNSNRTPGGTATLHEARNSRCNSLPQWYGTPPRR